MLGTLMTSVQTAKRSWARILGGIIVFGVLMGLRDALDSVALRALAAAGAFVILFLAVSSARKN